MRAGAIAGAALAAAGVTLAALALREPAASVHAVDEAPARHDARVRLTGGRWECDAVVPRGAGITVEDAWWVPLAGEKRHVLVAFREPPACDALPPEPEGILARASEPAWDSLQETDPVRWSGVPRPYVMLLFPEGHPPRGRAPLAVAAALVAGGGVLAWRSSRKA